MVFSAYMRDRMSHETGHWRFKSRWHRWSLGFGMQQPPKAHTKFTLFDPSNDIHAIPIDTVTMLVWTATTPILRRYVACCGSFPRIKSIISRNVRALAFYALSLVVLYDFKASPCGALGTTSMLRVAVCCLRCRLVTLYYDRLVLILCNHRL